MKHALITGGSSGIGRGLAERLLGKVERLSLVARDTKGALLQVRKELTARKTTTTIDTYAVDVNDVAESTKAIIKAFARHPVDVFVNCAGGSHVYGLFEEMTHEDIDQIVMTNCVSVLHWLRELLPRMRQHPSLSWPNKKGHIVLLSSRSGERTLPKLSAYTVAKGAVEKIAEAMQKEYARYGIVCTLVNPGSINTAFTEHWDEETRKAHNAESMPLGHVLDALMFAIETDAAVNKVSMESVVQWKAEPGVLG